MRLGEKQKTPGLPEFSVYTDLYFSWQGMRDSNPRKRSQSPVCYRYTNPLNRFVPKRIIYYMQIFGKVKQFFTFFRDFIKIHGCTGRPAGPTAKIRPISPFSDRSRPVDGLPFCPIF